MPLAHAKPSLSARIARAVTKRSRLCLVVLGLASLAAGSSLGGLRFDSSVEHLTDKTAPDWQRLEEARKTFGSDDVIVVAPANASAMRVLNSREKMGVESVDDGGAGVASVCAYTCMERALAA